jgi:hypothetical protein
LSPTRKILLIALLLVASTEGCSDRISQTPVTRPQTGRYALSGQVRISGRLTAMGGDSVGTRVLESASGVRVRLLRPDGSSDSVVTHNGVFEFRVDDPGLYRTTSWVCPEIVSTSQVVVTDADAIFPDTLTMGPFGEITTYPNPFPSSEGLAIEFSPPIAERVELSILALSGVPVWSYANDLPPGFQHFHWPGLDNDGHAVPNGAYWCVVRMSNAHHYNLVFKE